MKRTSHHFPKQPQQSISAAKIFLQIKPRKDFEALGGTAGTTVTYRINTAGTAYRMEDEPIPLRPALDWQYTSDGVVLRAIQKQIFILQGITVSS